MGINRNSVKVLVWRTKSAIAAGHKVNKALAQKEDEGLSQQEDSERTLTGVSFKFRSFVIKVLMQIFTVLLRPYPHAA
jgi:hypothetical protein